MRFVAFLGQEWTSSRNPPAEAGQPNRYGHHNLIYHKPFYDRFHDSWDGDISPRDLWKQLADVEFVCQKWDGMIPALLANKFDLIVASMSITEKRMQKIDFSIPYRISVGQFVGKKGANLNLFNSDGSPNPGNFKGLKVGLERATTYQNWINANVPSANVLLYDTNEALYLDLQNGRTDVIMTNPMKAFLKFLSKDKGKNFGFVSPPLDDPKIFGVGVGVGIAQGREDLLKRINSALKTLIQDGSLEKYSLKYFPFAIHNEKWEGVN